jgi:DNA helicase INO80
LITKGTVEEKIVKRAKQKQTVQSTVYGGNALKADVFRAKEVVDMLLDEDEEQDLKDRQQKFLRTRRVKRGPKPSAQENDESALKKRESQTPVKSQNNKEEGRGSKGRKSEKQNQGPQ